MDKEKIIEETEKWLEEKYNYSQYIDYELIAAEMTKLIEEDKDIRDIEDIEEIDFESLHQEVLDKDDEELLFPNGRDYDAENEDGI